MIELRECETDADLDAWLVVRRAVMPNERAPSLDELKQGTKPNDLLLLAVVDGDVAGSGLSKWLEVGGAFLMARVLPDRRGCGVGATLLRGLAEDAVAHGYTRESTQETALHEHPGPFS